MVLSVIFIDNDSATIDSLVMFLRDISPRLIATITNIPNEVAKILGENTAHIVFVNRDSIPSDVAASILQLPYLNVPVIVMGTNETEPAHTSSETQDSRAIIPLEEYRYRYSAVVDYLPLPCTKERVQMLIEHLRNWLALRELERWKDEQLISVIQKNAFLTQQLSDAGLSDREFSVDEDIHVVYCVAERNYSVLHRIQDATIQQEVISKSIGTLAEEFGEKYSSGEHPFLVRIHNSTIVNIKYVESVQKHDNRKDYIVRLRTGEEFILSRTYKRVVERLPKVEKKRRAARVTTRTRPTD